MNIKFTLLLVAAFCLLEVHPKGKTYEDVEDLMKQQAAHPPATHIPAATSTIVQPPQLNVHEVTSVNKVSNTNSAYTMHK